MITRKTNGCNRSKGGAQTHSILASVLATCRQHSIPILDYLVSLQRYGETPPSLISQPKSTLNMYRSGEGLTLAGGRGFEPLSTDPESVVLPLDEPPILYQRADFTMPHGHPSRVIPFRINNLPTLDKKNIGSIIIVVNSTTFHSTSYRCCQSSPPLIHTSLLTVSRNGRRTSAENAQKSILYPVLFKKNPPPSALFRLLFQKYQVVRSMPEQRMHPASVGQPLSLQPPSSPSRLPHSFLFISHNFRFLPAIHPDSFLIVPQERTSPLSFFNLQSKINPSLVLHRENQQSKIHPAPQSFLSRSSGTTIYIPVPPIPKSKISSTPYSFLFRFFPRNEFPFTHYVLRFCFPSPSFASFVSFVFNSFCSFSLRV